MGTIISWTDETWNFVTGCAKISSGCAHCYAESLSLRFGWSKKPWTKANEAENVTFHERRLGKPFTFKKPVRVFVNSMSDCFHHLVTDEQLEMAFDVMRRTPQHTYQVLTKRAERLPSVKNIPDNLWVGVSVENKAALKRLDYLRQVDASVRWISAEPLLEDLGDVDLTGIDWVVVGGESGAGFRPMDHAWARNIRDNCRKFGAAFFFKQSAARVTERGVELIEIDGTSSIIHEFPTPRTRKAA